MRVFVVTIAFTVQRRVFSSLLVQAFDEGHTIHVYPADNLPDSEGLWWLDIHLDSDGEEVNFDDCYGVLIHTDDLEGCCMEL